MNVQKFLYTDWAKTISPLKTKYASLYKDSAPTAQ